MGQVRNKRQLSVYLKNSTVRFIEVEAKRKGLSKSQMVDNLLERESAKFKALAAKKRLIGK